MFEKPMPSNGVELDAVLRVGRLIRRALERLPLRLVFVSSTSCDDCQKKR